VTTREAIEGVADLLTDELVICTTGYTCRDMQAASDREGNFYMIGSMGLAASLGLGVALCRPHRRVVVLDGDGSVLMGLGTLPMIGSLCPHNLIHLVLDNECFVSTGRQPTCSSQVPLERIASAVGYPVVQRVDTPQEIVSVWSSMRQRPGPAFVLVKCQPDAGAPLERVRLSPEAITERFMEAVR
jgi:thiamine pyrophosphate-dependent acetolactate synthase large subunit-like protein